MAKQKINFSLEGGGSKCVYQLSFLRNFFNDEYIRNNYELGHINGISFGAVIGFIFLLECDHITDTMMSDPYLLSKSIDIDKYRKYYSWIPIVHYMIDWIMQVVWIIYSIGYYGLYKLDNIEKYLDNMYTNTQEICSSNGESDKNNKLGKLNIKLYNLTENKIETINGYNTDSNIIQYILGGMSLWLLFSPKKIKQNEYIDIGFIQTIDILESTSDDINCYLLTNDPYESNIKLKKGNNLLEYLYNIIDVISTKYHNMTIINNNILEKPRTHVMYYNANIKTNEIDKQKILDSMTTGKNICNDYIQFLKLGDINKSKIIRY